MRPAEPIAKSRRVYSAEERMVRTFALLADEEGVGVVVLDLR